MTPSNCDVRYSPESRHSQAQFARRLWAKSGLVALQ
jgi:hypothetical protein